MATRPIDRFLEIFPDAKRNGNGWYDARCPAHEDRHASFGFHERADGSVEMKCHAGCLRGDVLKAIGLESRDCFPQPNGKGDRPRIVATYDYRDEQGRVLYQTVRREPGKGGRKKDYRQRQPRKPGMDLTDRYHDDQWVWDLQNIHPVLYRLPEILGAVSAGRTIYLVEGEPAAEALVRIGLDATTAPLGAGKWRHHYAKSIAGATVVCLPDNDNPGKAHMRDAAASLQKEGCRVRVFEIPDLPPAGDAVEFVRSGGTPEKLGLLLSERFGEPDAEGDREVPDEDDSGYRCSHIGNAERLVDKHGTRFRYCSSMSRFIIYDGARWTPDDAFEVERMAHGVVRSIPQEIEGISDPSRRKDVLRHAAASESDTAIRAMLNRCRPLPGVTVSATQFDTDPWLLNCLNGTVDLRTGKLRPHDPGDHLMKLAPVEYHPEAACPTFERFLRVVMREHGDLVTFLRRACGYSLTGIARERCLFILHGGGRNGKSTLLNAMRRVTGDYGIRTPTSTLVMSGNKGIPNDVARLAGTRFVTASETRNEGTDEASLDEAMIKDVTGGEPITARFLNREWFEFTPSFKLWLGTNHIPTIKGTDDGIWDRIRLVPFLQRFWIPGEEPGPEDLPADYGLQDALYAEAEGILAWAVRGCMDWQREGLTYPTEVRRAVQKYRADMDALLRFVETQCVLGKFENVGATDFFKAYQRWCGDEDILPESQTKLASRLKARGFTKEHTRSGIKWFGLKLKEMREVPSNDENCEELTEYEPGCEERLF